MYKYSLPPYFQHQQRDNKSIEPIITNINKSNKEIKLEPTQSDLKRGYGTHPYQSLFSAMCNNINNTHQVCMSITVWTLLWHVAYIESKRGKYGTVFLGYKGIFII